MIEEGTPLLSIADWLKFMVGRSTADQGALTRIMTKVLLRARWTENLCQALYDGWAISSDKRMSVVADLERMTDSCDVARRKTLRVTEQLQESKDQSSDLQVEMREDLGRLEDRLRDANEQLFDCKSQLGRAKEAAVAIKARSDRQVAQLASEKDAAVDSVRELRNSVETRAMETEMGCGVLPQGPGEDLRDRCRRQVRRRAGDMANLGGQP